MLFMNQKLILDLYMNLKSNIKIRKIKELSGVLDADNSVMLSNKKKINQKSPWKSRCVNVVLANDEDFGFLLEEYGLVDEVESIGGVRDG